MTRHFKPKSGLRIGGTVIFLCTCWLLFGGCKTASPVKAAMPVPVLDRGEISARLDRLLSAYDFYGRFSGTVLLAHKDTVLYENSFGFADAEAQLPNNNDSVYGLGSVSKQFTATAILELVQNGQLALSATLADFFPELGESAKRITIHHLLSMRSGIYEDFARSKSYDISQVVFPRAEAVGTHDLVHYFGELSSFFRPGARFDYSNLNYILLAAILESVSGLDYAEYLEQLRQKFDLDSIAFGIDRVEPKRLARPYVGLPLRHDAAPEWHDSWVLGAGGIFSSARDLQRWLYKVNSRQVLDASHSRLLFREHSKDGREQYGYGWQLGKRQGFDYIYHKGGTLGYVCEAGFFPELDLYLVILSNHSHDLMDLGKSVQLLDEIGTEIKKAVFNQSFRVLPLPQAEARMELAPSYTLNDFGYALSQKDNLVGIQALEGSPSILDLAFSQDLQGSYARYAAARKIAEAFGREDFAFVRRQAEPMMRLLIPASKLAEIWTELTGEKGRFLSYNFYRLPEGANDYSYRVRLVYQQKEVGVILNFNQRGQLRGIHIDQSFSSNGPGLVQALMIDNNLLFVDGFKHGYPDAKIELVDGRLVLRTVAGDLLLH